MTGLLTKAAIQWLEGRGISEETASRHGIESRKTDRGGEILTTPYLRDGVAVNHKHRLLADKRFWMDGDGVLCLWNSDILDDPVLQEDGGPPLVIVEGEMDGLACDEAGHPWVVSVPNGAKEAREEDGKPVVQALGFLESDLARLKKIKRFVIASDGDKAGRGLKDALLQALSLPRCHLAAYPDGTKDINDVLMKGGKEAVLKIIAEAEPVPYQGAYYARQFERHFGHEQYETSIKALDGHFRPFVGGFHVITGTPGTGKSLLAQSICYLLAKHHGLKAVIGSFENPPAQVIEEFVRMYAGPRATWNKDAKAWEIDKNLREKALKFIDEHFYFVVSDAPESAPEEEEAEETDLPWFLDAASTFVIREGAKVVVLDPWNELEHNRRRDETMSEYISRSIREMKRWARRRKVILIVVAHPTKLEYDPRKKKFRKVTLYDIYGSSGWFDKSDIGMVLERSVDKPHELEVDIQKMRFKDTGRLGTPIISWNENLARYESVTML